MAEAVADFLHDRKLLLVLDNFEHVADAAPQVIDLVLEGSSLKALVASRASLRVSGEHEYPVPELAESDAIALFSERARAMKPDFRLNGDSLAVAEICRRPDGLPLAIELAAARARVLSPTALLARLEERLPVLTGGARDLPARQRTLRDTIAWSYELLDESEQQLFSRLAVFPASFTLEAAEAICEADLDTLTSLVEKSLLRQGEGRFWMLETIREFAAERLAGGGELDETAAATWSSSWRWQRRHRVSWTRTVGGLSGSGASSWSTTTAEPPWSPPVSLENGGSSCDSPRRSPSSGSRALISTKDEDELRRLWPAIRMRRLRCAATR